MGELVVGTFLQTIRDVPSSKQILMASKMTVMGRSLDLVDDSEIGDELTRASSTLAGLVGVSVLLICTVKTVFAAYRGFRLYLWSQFFCSNKTRKYGDWAIVTGAANGIGRSMARELARRGHSIVAIDIDRVNLAQTRALLERELNAGQVRAIEVDLADSSSENYARLQRQLDLDNMEVGILVNNAGLATKQSMMYGFFHMDEIRRTLNVNVLATAFMTRMLLPHMAAHRRGLILNVSSVMAGAASIYTGVYGSSKAFVSEFSRFLQQEYSHDHVDVVSLTPCAVRTAMLIGESGTSSVPSLLMVSPDGFAKSALNAIGSGVNCYSGHWTHGIWRLNVSLIKNLGLLPLAQRVFFGVKTTSRSAAEKNQVKGVVV